MKKLPVIKLILITVFAAVIAYCAYNIITLSKENNRYNAQIAQRNASDTTIENFLNTENQNVFINNKVFETSGATAPEPDVSDALYYYITPEGFPIKSNSEYWKEDQLEQLYVELLKNKHGRELAYLSDITILPQKDDYALAYHDYEDKSADFELNIPALPKDFDIKLTCVTGIITLYGGDENQTVESMARSLSHEYGHQYTLRYMLDAQGENGTTEYARLRDTNTNIRTYIGDLNDYKENHEWYLIEIAAEDYVFLMGSPTVRQQTADYYDVRQYLDGTAPDQSEQYIHAMNALPQENLMLPLPSDVPGLADYFYSFIDETAPAQSTEKQNITISISEKSVPYHLTTGYKTFISYSLTWNTPYADGTVYTLVSFTDDGEYKIYPIKTVRPGHETSATIGTVTAESNGYVQSLNDKLASGTRTFIVTAVLPDGTIFTSEPLIYDFD